MQNPTTTNHNLFGANMNHLIPSFGLTAALLAATLAPAAHAADLTIQIDNVAAAQGNLMIGVYDSDATFLRQPVQAIKIPAQLQGNSITFHDLPAGDYAIAVYHDANANGQLDFQSNGVPQEMTGFSNNAEGRFGPPRFDAAKFSVQQTGTLSPIRLR
jgi:uncharacterized protein (DUF2141 family)